MRKQKRPVDKASYTNPFRVVVLVALVLILLENLALTVLLPDLSSLIPATIHLLLIYLLVSNHRFARFFMHAWAIIYIFIFTGIQTAAKTLIIWRGDGWEVDSGRYNFDLFLLSVGVMVLFFEHKIFPDNPRT